MSEPMGFRQINLGEIVEVLDHLRVPISGEERDKRKGTVPYYGANGLVGWIDHALFDEPLILLAEDGGNFDDYRDRPIAYRISGPSWVNNHAHVVRAQAGINQSYVYWSLVHKDIRKYIAGGTRTKLNQSELREIEITLPTDPLEAKAIARILDTLDTQIEKTQALIAKLEQVKQGLLHDLLTRGVDENGELRPSAEEAPELYKASALGLIPREWLLIRLEDVATVNRGKFTHRPRNDPRFFGGTVPFIQTGDIAAADGEWLLDASQTLSPLGITASQEFPAGTIAITIAANIADTAILGVPMFFPDSVVGAVVNQRAETQYIEMCIRTAKRGLVAKAPQSAQKNINLQDLRPLPIPLPSLTEQRAIVKRFLGIKRQLAAESAILERLRRAKSGLMDDLLTGRVRVTPLLDHEPAEAT